MAAASWFKYTRLAFLSHPKSDRQLYRLIKRYRVARIVHVGLRSLEQSVSLIEVAQRFATDAKVVYTGLDWFEARPKEQPPLTLKQTHAALHATGAQVRLVPGPVGQSLANIANSHPNTQMLLIASIATDEELEAAWFYVPRMLRPDSLIFRERTSGDGKSTFSQLSVANLADRVERAAHRRAA